MNFIVYASRVIVFFISLLFAGESCAKVDPFWLSSWNEAVSLKPSKLKSISRIANKNELGTKLIIHGKVSNPDGSPSGSVVVHAYHRDNDGYDFGLKDKELTTWRLQGWAITDAGGRFTFHTIRPAHDFLSREGAHIHFTTISQKFGRQWAPTVFFANDPMLTKELKARSKEAEPFGFIKDVTFTEDEQEIHVTIKLKRKTDF